jgi:hypothetical protein
MYVCIYTVWVYSPGHYVSNEKILDVDLDICVYVCIYIRMYEF